MKLLHKMWLNEVWRVVDFTATHSVISLSICGGDDSWLLSLNNSLIKTQCFFVGDFYLFPMFCSYPYGYRQKKLPGRKVDILNLCGVYAKEVVRRQGVVFF